MGSSTSRQHEAMATPRQPGKLTGASLCVLSSDEATRQAAALGGTIVRRVEDATHCIVSNKLGTSAEMSRAMRSKLLLAVKCNVPVLHTAWLEAVAQITSEQHWSDVPLELFTPPTMATLVHESKQVEQERRARLNRQRTRRRNNTSQIASSLDESWAHLMKEQPAEVEEHELRRAIEMSLLDSAVTLRRDVALGPPKPSNTPEQVLGVAVGASAEEIREAFKRRCAAAARTSPRTSGRMQLPHAIAACN